ncbi:MAG: zinc ribbon domain-containing protein [Eubacterium sp.]|nr:zinc ribbon domain-containing protein [Eubacterium sp.]
MFCKNCGNEIENDAAFCPQCGYRLKEHTPQQESPVCPVCHHPIKPGAAFCTSCGANLSNTQQATDKPVHTRKKLLIIGSIAIAVLAVGGITVALASSLPKLMYRSSPEKYYRYAEIQNLENDAAIIGDLYDSCLEQQKKNGQGATVNLTARLEDGGRSLLGTVVPMDLSWLKEISLNTTGRSDESAFGAESTLSLNDTPLASLHLSGDFDLQEIYMTIPEISSDYLGMNLSSILSQYGGDFSSLQSLEEMMTDLSEFCEDGDTVEELLVRYGTIVFNHITDVDKSSETLEINGISEKVTTLEARITPSDFAAMGKEMIPLLRKDDDLRQIITACGKMAALQDSGNIDGNSYYQEFLYLLDSLESELNQLAENADYYYLLSRICIGKSDQITSRTLTLVANGEYLQLLSYSRPQNGKTFALNTTVNLEDYTMAISGSGTVSGEKENADYTISVDGIPYLRLRTSDFDTEKAKKGYINGTFTLSPLAGISSLSGADELGGILNNYALKLNCNSSEKSSQIELSVMSSDLPLITISSEYLYEDSGSTDFPKSSDKVYNLENEDEILQYVSSINWDQVLQTLHKTDIPSEYMSILENYIQQMRSAVNMYNR